jgi:hypothetical protein
MSLLIAAAAILFSVAAIVLWLSDVELERARTQAIARIHQKGTRRR